MSASFTGAYSQDFNALPTSGTSLVWANDSTLPGWSLFRQPAPGTAITAINANSGSNNTGTFDSFGVAGTNPLTDRALGGVGSAGAYFGSPLVGTLAGWIAVALTNDSAATVNTLDLRYTGEQWRDGGDTAAQTMTLEYGFGSSFTNVSTWILAPSSGFNFTSPTHTATAAALDGNLAANRTTGLGGVFNSLGWKPGDTLWVRWIENNDIGNDHGLSVDDVSVRVVPENLIVDTLVDEIDGNHLAGDLSLREAIGLANDSSGSNTIAFAAALTSGGPATISLTSLGELAIDDSLTISGPGANLLTIQAYDPDANGMNDGDGSRVFNIDDGSSATQLDVEVIGLRLTGGDVVGSGGGIFNSENLQVVSSTITGNAAAGSVGTAANGGGIYCYYGNLTFTDSTISNNLATGPSEFFGGGGISVREGILSVTNCTISGNQAPLSNGGGICIFSYGNLTVTNSNITGNHAGLGGGGIHTVHNTAAIIHCTISGNSADTYGGGFDATAVADVTVTDTTISDNFANRGGGINNRSGVGQIAIAGSTISGNHAGDRGGGLYLNSIATVTRSTISGNSAPYGGGVWYYPKAFVMPKVSIASTTISNNTATIRGGGIYNFDGNFFVQSSTITENTAPSSEGGGIASNGNANTRTEVRSSIVAGNTGGDVSYVVDPIDSFDSQGYNLIGNGNAVGEFNRVGDQTGIVDPMLEALADNGGPTFTRSLLAGSPAIDSGDPAALAGSEGVPLYDQRGMPFARVFNGDGIGGARIDIGAFELQPMPPALPGDYNHDTIVDAADYTVWRDTLGTNGLAPYEGADGSGDGIIALEDYGVWKSHFGETLPPGGGGAVALTFAEPMLNRGEAILPLPAASITAPVEAKVVALSAVGSAMLAARLARHDLAAPPRERTTEVKVVEPVGDHLLLLLASDRLRHSSRQSFSLIHDRGNNDTRADESGKQDPFSDPLALALAEWQ